MLTNKNILFFDKKISPKLMAKSFFEVPIIINDVNKSQITHSRDSNT